MKSSNTTLEDIARMAEVSKSTVSLVINGSPKVNAKTSARIWSIIRDFGYQPSEKARKLAQKRWEISDKGSLQVGLSSSDISPVSEAQIGD